MFTRQHYLKLAEVLAYSNASPLVIEQMLCMLQRDNENFCKTTFIGRISGLQNGGI
jgi:hypothetical protein